MLIHKFENDSTSYFMDEKGVFFRRMVGGLGWPGPMADGFAVVVAEEYREWPPLGRHRLFLMAEREAREVSQLLKMAADLQGEFKIQPSDWFGQATNNPMKSELDLFNRESPHIYIKDAPDIEHPRVLEKYLRLIRELLNPDKKTLLLSTEENLLKDHHLPQIDEIELKEAKIEDQPAIVALGAAVTALEYRPFVDHTQYHRLRKELLDRYDVEDV